MTKVIGGVCGAFLIFLLGKWAAEEIYHVGSSGHGDHATQGYVIDTGEDHAEAEVEEDIETATVGNQRGGGQNASAGPVTLES